MKPADPIPDPIAHVPTTPPPPERLVLVHYRGRTRRGPQRLTKALVGAGHLTTPSLPPAPRAIRRMWKHDLALGINPFEPPPEENHP